MDKPISAQNFDDSSPGYKPMTATGTTEENPLPSIDFLGALWRRKSVLVLLAAVGAGLAGLLYTQMTPTFASVTRVMIWMQAPPSVINGEVFQQQVVLEKQQTLLASTTVLGSAIENRALKELDTFKGSESALSDLRKMLTVTPVGKDLTSDALEIKCEGKIKKDLTLILDAVVDSYQKAIEGYSNESGTDSIKLIEKLQKELMEDEARKSDTYRKMLIDMRLTSENARGVWENPYLADLEKLKLQRDQSLKLFRESDQLLEQIQSSLDPDRPNNDLLRLAVVEAKKYFNLLGREDGYAVVASEDRQRVSRYEQRIEVANSEVLVLEAEREEAAKRWGEKHPQVEFIDSKYKAAMAAKSRLSQELDALLVDTSDGEFRVRKKEATIQDARSQDEEMVRLYAASLTNQRSRAKYDLEKINQDFVDLTKESEDISSQIMEVNMLREQIDERRTSIAQILEKLSEFRALSGNYTTTKVKTIDEASFPERVFPVLWKFLLVGTLLGGLVGAGLAVLIDHSDLAYRTPIDIQESLNVPVICKVPKIRKGKIEKDFTGSPMLVAAINPSSSAAETFRAARTSLMFAAGQTGHKVFMFTSPSPGDGKSTTVANLAISLAQTNKRVCLVDADYRRPRVQQNFGVQFEPGGMQYLLGEATLDEALRPCVFQSNLTLMTTGGRPKNPGELVASSAFADMVGELRSRFDIVLIDSPPVIPVADATSLCSVVDGIILILRIRRGVILSAHKAKERLDLVQGNLMGVVVNGMDENLYYNEYGTYYRGSYYYGSSYARSYDKEYSDYSDKVRDRGEKRAVGKS